MSAIGPRRTLLSGSLGRDVQNWRGAVIVNGGTVTPARLASVSMLIQSLKASGAWANADDYWLLVADNATQALTSLKQRRLATAVNSPTFTANAGYTFDGVTNYIDTGFVPANHAVAMTVTNVRTSVYERTNINSSTYGLGEQATGNRRVGIRTRFNGNMFGEANSLAATFTLPVADSRGLSATSRNGPDTTTHMGYKNDVSLTRSVDATGFGTLPANLSVFIGGTNVSGALNTPRASTIGWATVGASLTAAQELAEYNAIQAYMTAWGAGV